jgi:hypothetical protein
MSEFCLNAPSSGNIEIGTYSSKSIEMRHITNTNPDSSYFCSWAVEYESPRSVTLKIKRDCANYEDIVIKVNTTSKSQYYTSKDFSDCSKEIFYLYVDDVNSIEVRTKPQNSLSAYVVLLESNGEEAFTLAKIIAIVVGTVVMSILFLIVLVIVIYSVRDMIIKRRERIRRQLDAIDFVNNKNQRIQDTLSMMKHGEMQKFENKYHEKQCVIWLEKFELDSQICITNEWSHLFHFYCLKEWYNSINASKQLYCPHWKIENFANPKTNESNEPKTIHREVNSLSEMAVEDEFENEIEIIVLPNNFTNPLQAGLRLPNSDDT